MTRKQKPARKVRKPREFKSWQPRQTCFWGHVYEDSTSITIGEPWRENALTAKEARKLGQWLLRASDYIEQNEKGSR